MITGTRQHPNRATEILCSAGRYYCKEYGLDLDLHVSEILKIENLVHRNTLKIIICALCEVNGASPEWMKILKQELGKP